MSIRDIYTKKIRLQMRQQHPKLKHFQASGRNNAATKMSNYAQLYNQLRRQHALPGVAM
jgi:hypothetical protein